MGEMAEDRVYDDRREETVAYVASGRGVATVRVASDRVGRFALAERCDARDVVAADGRVYAATDEDVLAGPDPFEPLGFERTDAADGAAAVGVSDDSPVAVGVGDDGPVAVGVDDDGAVLAADSAGRVARYRDGEWDALGSVEEVRALERDLVAAADGVYRVVDGGLVHAGLKAVRDVAVDGAPLAATDDGLYRLGNGWLRERGGAFTTVAAGADRAHAATAEELFVRGSDEWTAVDLPTAETEAVVGVAYGECVYAVTDRGTFLVDADPERTPDGTGGWRSRSLGLPDVSALAVA